MSQETSENQPTNLQDDLETSPTTSPASPTLPNTKAVSDDEVEIENEVDTENDNETNQCGSDKQEQKTEEKVDKETKSTDPITLTINLSDVSYSPTFRMNRGALAQHVVNLKHMRDRLDKPSADNKIQAKLYPAITKICDNLYNAYVKLCDSVDDNHVREFSYFLMGPYNNGTLRQPTRIRGEKKMYKFSELGPSFRAMSNRLFHAKREVENRLTSEKYSGDVDSYTALKKFLDDFSAELTTQSEEWKNTVYKVRDEEGIVKEKKEYVPRKITKGSKRFNKQDDKKSDNKPRLVRFKREGDKRKSLKKESE
jgi:hypothetical protein